MKKKKQMDEKYPVKEEIKMCKVYVNTLQRNQNALKRNSRDNRLTVPKPTGYEEVCITFILARFTFAQ